ncbi:MAG: PAS domain-containing protein [Alphaproteobacteria bacterium]
MSLALKDNSLTSAASLKRASIEAGFIIEGSPYPTALWSLDRRFCVFNPLVSELLGYSDQEISHRPELYVDRINPEDRGHFLSVWQRVCDGEKKASCRYRFIAKHGTETRVRENSLLFPIDGGKAQGALTFYAEERKEAQTFSETHQLRSLLRGLTHKIGNNLQAITGELELLEWSGTLPAGSAAVASSAVMQIRALTSDIEKYVFSALGGNNDSASPSELRRNGLGNEG